MFSERTSVGLDVHARSVSAAAIDGQTGELIKARLAPAYKDVLGWVAKLPGPCAVVYEAGPTGFGLARALSAAGIRCEVAASSKLHRPPGDRVKTDARDALLLARLLRLDEIVSVRVPSAGQEAARDLVRAREASRSDLMRARHRLSKLLLRQGIVYTDGKAWTQLHERWLGRQRFELAGTQAAFDDAYETVVLADARRDRLDEKITAMAGDCEFTPVGAAVGVPARYLHPHQLRPGCRDRRLGPVHRLEHRRLPRAGAQRALLRAVPRPGRDHQDREHPCAAPAGRGCLAPPNPLPAQPGAAAPVGPRTRPQPGPARTSATSDCINAGSPTTCARNGR